MSKQYNHAVVIGGSMAGLLAARVLADHFERVTIIERDHLPDEPELRGGVPQARHLHALLARGLQILEELFPGITVELDEAGALPLHWGKESRALLSSNWSPIFNSSVHTRSLSRQLLEWVVRRQLEKCTNVTFIEQTQADHLLTTPDKTRVTGIAIQSRTTHESQNLDADFVVDASGRGSHAPDWLESLGYGRPQETEVNAFLGYSTRWYKRPSGYKLGMKSIAIQTRPPHNLRGGGFLEVENDQWIVTLVGVNGDYPPTDEAGFLEFARSLAAPDLYDAINDAEPISGVYGYQRTANQLRHYERLERWPENFAVIGDAACAFNPVYGQGMTTGALSALALQKCFQTQNSTDLAGLGQNFQKQLSKVIQIPWLMATGEDLRYPGTKGDKPGIADRFVQKYIDRVIRIMPDYPNIVDAFFQVMNLLQPPTILFRPNIAVKVFGSIFRAKISP